MDFYNIESAYKCHIIFIYLFICFLWSLFSLCAIALQSENCDSLVFCEIELPDTEASL